MYVISWPRSNAPLMQSIPISKVAPSPAITMTFSFLPCFLSEASMPEATADAFSKSEWIHGTFHAVSGYGVEKTSMQPVEETTMEFGPAALSISRAASAAPHPPQARCPESKSSQVLSTMIRAPPCAGRRTDRRFPSRQARRFPGYLFSGHLFRQDRGYNRRPGYRTHRVHPLPQVPPHPSHQGRCFCRVPRPALPL